jgi:mannosylglycerate hydrolase
MAKDARWKLLVVSHTHWDREWYFPFETFRIRLVALMDGLLDLLDRDPNFRFFMLDGYSLLPRDYLEVRPERRGEIERHARAGRLLVGPWYVLPDEFLVGGESLIRNLQLGLRLARQFGPPMMVGYVPDTFGHVAHMPAILRGFGIEQAVIWRGVGADLEKTEFLWQAPDGSEVLTLYMPDGYGNANRLPSDPDGLSGRIAFIRKELEPRATTPYLLLMNGTDHTSVQEDLTSIMAAAERTADDVEVIHSSLPQAFELVRRSLAKGVSDLYRHTGEFRDCQRAHILPGVLSARTWIKQRNQECEDLLTRWAEPFSSWVSLLRQRLGSAWRETPLPLGPASPFPAEPASLSGLLDVAWEHLLQNQPHDSICGCSVDQVHDEMRPRFDRCQQIGEEITRYCLRAMAYNMPSYDGRGLVAFNPLSGPRSDFVSAPVGWGEDEEPVAAVDEAGLRVPCQVLVPPGGGIPWGTVGFVAPDVPGHGYKAFRLEYGRAEAAGPTAGDAAIENEHFRVSAEPTDGTVTLFDKASGRELRGLNRIVDGGDRGDEYNYCRPARDELVESPCRPPRIAVVEAGPARWVLEILMEYSLPRGLSDERDLRSPDTVPCPITTRVTIYGSVRRVEFHTEVDNQADDHRLRVHFPTDMETDTSHAEQHFGVVARPVALPQFDETWIEDPVGTHPQKSFVDVSGGGRGLLLANHGLPEYEVLPASPGDVGVTVALTLLRCVGFLSRGDLTSRRGPAGAWLPVPDAQNRGRHAFDYALVPHEGDWQDAFEEAHRFAVPLRGRRVEEGTGALPAEASLIDITPPTLVVSAVRMAVDGKSLVVRLYNIAPAPVEGRVRAPDGCERAEMVNMDGALLAEAPLEDGWVRLTAKPNEIVNLRFVIAR